MRKVGKWPTGPSGGVDADPRPSGHHPGSRRVTHSRPDATAAQVARRNYARSRIGSGSARVRLDEIPRNDVSGEHVGGIGSFRLPIVVTRSLGGRRQRPYVSTNYRKFVAFDNPMVA